MDLQRMHFWYTGTDFNFLQNSEGSALDRFNGE
jgi:hypothetical protein